MDYEIRRLIEGDISSSFFDTLANLDQEVDRDVTRAREVFGQLNSNPLYHFFVAVSSEDEVIGLATLLVEQKFIQGFTLKGYLEDVVVRKEYEGNGIARALVHKISEFADELGCYRINLTCRDELLAFYRSEGYSPHSNQLVRWNRS
jgi:glucosamine-phosphate N-acetyltransferase